MRSVTINRRVVVSGVLFALLGCIALWGIHRVRSQWGERLSRNDVIIDQKVPSPDGSKLLIVYRFDNGALGYSSTREVVVPREKAAGELSNFRLPDKYSAVEWQRDGTLLVEVNLVTCAWKAWDCAPTSDLFQGTRLNIRQIDDTAGKEREIEADLPSPDRKLRFVAYRYPSDDRSNLGPIHISIIRPDEQIPQYGNFYIASGSGDGVLGASWNGNSSIVFFTSDDQKYLLEYQESFIRGGPQIDHTVKINNALHGYLWLADAQN